MTPTDGRGKSSLRSQALMPQHVSPPGADFLMKKDAA